MLMVLFLLWFRYTSSEAGYGSQSEPYSAPSDTSGRHSRASSSSSSGCMSDGAPSSCENAFESEFPMGKCLYFITDLVSELELLLQRLLKPRFQTGY